MTLDLKPKKTSLVFVLHGVGSSAEIMSQRSVEFSNAFPNSEVIFLNAHYDITGEINARMRQRGVQFDPNQPRYSWFGDRTLEEERSDLLSRIRSFNPNNLPYALFGFSQGGFLAAELIAHAPRDLRAIFLHSAAIIKPVPKVSEKAHKPVIRTLIALDDPYLRSRAAILMLTLHFLNTTKLTFRGYDVKTRISWGFGHGISEKSLKIASRMLGV